MCIVIGEEGRARKRTGGVDLVIHESYMTTTLIMSPPMRVDKDCSLFEEMKKSITRNLHNIS